MPDCSTFLSSRGFHINLALGLWAWAAAALPLTGNAQIQYSVAGSEHLEDFDLLPTDTPSNANIETIYPDGWRDDAETVPGSHVSLPGWYLHHPLSPANENGFNGHQRLRMGAGQNTGGFWGFAAGAWDFEKALGSIGSLTVAGNNEEMYIALRLVNTTGFTLNSFKVTYDGEQWRDGASASPETLLFGYSIGAAPENWLAALFTPVEALDFTAPVFESTATSGTAVNGRFEGLVRDITATIEGIVWEPGAELWLRWADPQLPSVADDGLAIDNVRFTAVPEPAGMASLLVGAAALLGLRRPRSQTI